ncbi:unnamed protein product [Effrenium voratum]|nr:unnamed protein product [Effrenium voratum]
MGGTSSVAVGGEHRVRLAVNSLIGAATGCWSQDAYHTAVVVDEFEYSFSPMGVVKQRLTSATDCTLVEVGMSTMSGRQMTAILAPIFAPGSYDMLWKNCNTFSDCALFCLMGQRLDAKYRALERVGAFLDDLTGAVRFLSMCRYKPNPKAREFDLVSVLRHIDCATRQQLPKSAVGERPIQYARAQRETDQGPQLTEI